MSPDSGILLFGFGNFRDYAGEIWWGFLGGVGDTGKRKFIPCLDASNINVIKSSMKY